LLGHLTIPKREPGGHSIYKVFEGYSSQQYALSHQMLSVQAMITAVSRIGNLVFEQPFSPTFWRENLEESGRGLKPTLSTISQKHWSTAELLKAS
jgi:hypothetical protein